jgi:DNA transformation protein and related proteins
LPKPLAWLAMSSSKANVDYLLGQMQRTGNVSARAMFGEYALYCDGKVVGLFCDDQLFLKPLPAVEAAIGKHNKGPPYPGAKPHIIVPEDIWDDVQIMSQLVRITADALPHPKAKKKPVPKKKGK